MNEEPHASRAFEALANPYRRRLLLAMFEANPQDDDIDPFDLLKQGKTADNPHITQVSLNHVHLPKLADMRFIEWDRESGALSKGPNWDEIAPLLQLMQNHQDKLPEGWVN